MLIPDIRKHLAGLNDFCTKKLESAVGSCVNWGHYELRFEHLLSVCIESDEGDIPEILVYFGITPHDLKEALVKDLESFQNGSTGKPSFAPPLLETFERAWTIATLGFSLSAISSGTLLAAHLERYAAASGAVSLLLRKINLQTLLSEYDTIVKLSSEQSTQTARGHVKTPQGNTPKDTSEALSSFCVNFTQQARDGKIDQILGRDDEIRQAIDILGRRRKNNPIFVGEAGVGKTAVIEGIALRIAQNDVPEILRSVDIWGLDLGLLQAGASVKGEFEKRLKGVIEAIKTSATPVILFIDEAHTLIGAGGNAGMGDAANLLKPALARGEMKTMAATTWSEYRKYFEKDPALARRFQLVAVEEPTEERAIAMVRGVATAFEKFHGITITDDGIKAAVTYSHRYISGRQLPDKAIDVLDTACARVKMSQSAKPGTLDHAERNLVNAKQAKKRLLQDHENGIIINQDELFTLNTTIDTATITISNLNAQWESEKKAVTNLVSKQDLFKKETDEALKETLRVEIAKAQLELESIAGESPMVFPYVNSAVCARVIADWTAIPIGSMMKDEAKTLVALEEILTNRVIGQNAALASLANTIRSAKTGMGNPDSPIGVFLFSGPSGVGKTESALALADALFGGEKFTTVINMSEYQEKHTVSQLKGAPPGYVGYGEGGILTEAVRQKPYSVVILDEVEKAHLEVMNLFYQVFDKGFMRDGEGREINFRNTVIIMTSNLGTDTIMDMCTQPDPVSDDQVIDAIRPELSAHFRPALLARCTVIPFRPLSTEILAGIIGMKLDKIAARIKATHGIAFTYSDTLVSQLSAGCTASEAGARNADAIIKSQLLPAISHQLLTNLANESQSFTKLYVGENEEGDFSIVFSGDDNESNTQEKNQDSVNA